MESRGSIYPSQLTVTDIGARINSTWKRLSRRKNEAICITHCQASQGHMSHSRQDSSMKKRKETESNVSHFFFFFSLSSLPEKLQIQDSGVVKKCTYHSIPFMTLDYSSEMQKFYRFFFFSRLYDVCYYNTLGKTGYNKLQKFRVLYGASVCFCLLCKIPQRSEVWL